MCDGSSRAINFVPEKSAFPVAYFSCRAQGRHNGKVHQVPRGLSCLILPPFGDCAYGDAESVRRGRPRPHEYIGCLAYMRRGCVDSERERALQELSMTFPGATRTWTTSSSSSTSHPQRRDFLVYIQTLSPTHTFSLSLSFLSLSLSHTHTHTTFIYISP